MSCAPSKQATTNVQLGSRSNKDLVYMNSSGYGKSEDKARKDAFVRALDIILYSGIPEEGSPIKRPLIADKEEAEEKYGDFLASLSTDESIAKYFLNATQIGQPEKYKNFQEIRYAFQINLSRLKADLVEENVIRKFGF